jgi:hypothetical protein
MNAGFPLTGIGVGSISALATGFCNDGIRSFKRRCKCHTMVGYCINYTCNRAHEHQLEKKVKLIQLIRYYG